MKKSYLLLGGAALVGVYIAAMLKQRQQQKILQAQQSVDLGDNIVKALFPFF